MKNLSFSISFVLLFSLQSFGQKTLDDFCSTLDKVIKASTKNFADIRLTKADNGSYYSSVNFSYASTSSYTGVDNSVGEYFWASQFETKDEEDQKQLQKKMKSMIEAYTFVFGKVEFNRGADDYIAYYGPIDIIDQKTWGEVEVLLFYEHNEENTKFRVNVMVTQRVILDE